MVNSQIIVKPTVCRHLVHGGLFVVVFLTVHAPAVALYMPCNNIISKNYTNWNCRLSIK